MSDFTEPADPRHRTVDVTLASAAVANPVFAPFPCSGALIGAYAAVRSNPGATTVYTIQVDREGDGAPVTVGTITIGATQGNGRIVKAVMLNTAAALAARKGVKGVSSFNITPDAADLVATNTAHVTALFLDAQ